MQRTWTNFTGVCRSCGESFQASQEAIDETRKDSPAAMTDEAIGTGLDICLECLNGEAVEGEKPELDALVEAATDSFWSTCAQRTSARTGDFPPFADLAFMTEARKVIREWVRLNVVQVDQ
jgi:hypothetical protein